MAMDLRLAILLALLAPLLHAQGVYGQIDGKLEAVRTGRAGLKALRIREGDSVRTYRIRYRVEDGEVVHDPSVMRTLAGVGDQDRVIGVWHGKDGQMWVRSLYRKGVRVDVKTDKVISGYLLAVSRDTLTVRTEHGKVDVPVLEVRAFRVAPPKRREPLMGDRAGMTIEEPEAGAPVLIVDPFPDAPTGR